MKRGAQKKDALIASFFVSVFKGLAATGPCRAPSLGSRSFARANGAGQAAVVEPVSVMPEWYAKLDTLAEYFDF